ncbi:ribonuclease E/G [Anaerococcus marasmi]|uniref:ribonuclease E/G n=1 Tax=Anaerococcus marasmi TaxID=2057797 RepID=UPI000CF981BA|nr:ribonuclease E/G [Anaerococcus marasmi]
MTDFVFIDEKQKLMGKVKEDRIVEIKFYDSLLGNIYRGKVVNKNDALSAYFVEYEKGETLYLNSKTPYKIGDNVIVQYVRDPANGKLALGSLNFKLENDSYYVKRFGRLIKQKEGKERDKVKFEAIGSLKTRLIQEEKFFPTPKLLYENSLKDVYIEENKDKEIRKVDIENLKEFRDFLGLIKEKRPRYGDLSLIIDELETMTVIDVNSNSKKSTNNKDKFLENINMELIDPIVYNLKARNIGGMVLIDFLRNENKEKIEEAMREKSKEYDLDSEIFGFSPMGLFEMTIKRRGDRYATELKKRNLLN